MSNIGLAAVDARWFGATSLHVLDLSGNKLGKSDSFEIRFLNIARLQHLRVLLLADNEIQRIPVTSCFTILKFKLVFLIIGGFFYKFN